MPAIGMKVEQKGPLFEKGGVIIKQTTEKFVQYMVELGEQRLDIVLRPRPSPGVYLTVQQAQPGQASTGNYRRNVEGKRQGLSGRITDGGVEYGPWLESGKGRSPTRFRGYHAFQQTGTWLNERAKKEAHDFTKRYVKRLHGV